MNQFNLKGGRVECSYSVSTSLKMTKLEIQRKLYDARNAYTKAQKEVEFQKREILFLNQCWNEFDLDLYSEMFGEPCSL